MTTSRRPAAALFAALVCASLWLPTVMAPAAQSHAVAIAAIV